MHEAWPTSHGRNQSARLRRKILDLRRKTMAGELRLLGSPPLAQRLRYTPPCGRGTSQTDTGARPKLERGWVLAASLVPHRPRSFAPEAGGRWAFAERLALRARTKRKRSLAGMRPGIG